MKKILFLASVALMLACNNQKKEKAEIVETKTEEKVESSVYEFENYAVVWTWTTTDKQLVTENSPAFSEELISLWENGSVENAYYNSDAKIDKFENFPNISFFLKAKSYETAETMLNNLTIVKKGIAVYSIYPVGTLWLGINKEVEKEKLASSFAAVWTTKPDVKPSDDIVLKQNNSILKLWNDARIENVYFDIEGTQKANNKTDFVFYVNATSIDAAKQTCDQLPFAVNGIASYELFPVGVHWLGKYEK